MNLHLTLEGESVEIPDTDLDRAPDSVLSIATTGLVHVCAESSTAGMFEQLASL